MLLVEVTHNDTWPLSEILRHLLCSVARRLCSRTKGRQEGVGKSHHRRCLLQMALMQFYRNTLNITWLQVCARESSQCWESVVWTCLNPEDRKSTYFHLMSDRFKRVLSVSDVPNARTCFHNPHLQGSPKGREIANCGWPLAVSCTSKTTHKGPAVKNNGERDVFLRVPRPGLFFTGLPFKDRSCDSSCSK